MTISKSLVHQLHLLFRLAVCAEFVGHGAFGIIGKAAWLPYFAAFGISEEWAWRLMPVVGGIDITLGLLALLSPRRLPLLWMAFWGLMTALLRPVAGEPLWEAVERAGNVGAPLALLLLSGVRGTGLGFWLWKPAHPVLTLPAALPLILRLTTSFLLIGHGMLAAAVGKAGLAAHWDALGLPGIQCLPLVGALEITLGVTALLTRSYSRLFLGICLWKIGNELLFPLSGQPMWEFIERAGSYAAPLALFLISVRSAAHGKEK